MKTITLAGETFDLLNVPGSGITKLVAATGETFGFDPARGGFHRWGYPNRASCQVSAQEMQAARLKRALKQHSNDRLHRWPQGSGRG